MHIKAYLSNKKDERDRVFIYEKVKLNINDKKSAFF
jgi:hypothetical protein